MISKEMIKKGFKTGKMSIEDAFEGCIGLCCRIGDVAFYFASGEDAGLTAKEFCSTYTSDAIANKLHEALKDKETAEEYGLDEDEYSYYESILDEKRNPYATKKLWARIGFSLEVSVEEYEELKIKMETNPSEAESLLYNLFKERGEMNGNSYLPADCDDNPNEDDFEF